MGHCIEYRDFPISKNPTTEILAELDEYTTRHGDWGCGLPNDIRWLYSVTPFDCWDDAVEYMDRVDRGDYDQIAVRYRAIPRNNKSVEKAKRHLSEAREAQYVAERQENYPATRTSQFITCPECGSKLNREKLIKHVTFSGRNQCPLCRCDLRPKSSIDAYNKRVAKADAAVERATKALREAEKRAAKNGEVRWCIKIEYHI